MRAELEPGGGKVFKVKLRTDTKKFYFCFLYSARLLSRRRWVVRGDSNGYTLFLGVISTDKPSVLAVVQNNIPSMGKRYHEMDSGETWLNPK
jgi:hypothetical protein